MPPPRRAQKMFGADESTIERLARSRTAAAHLVERARIVRSARPGDTVAEIAAAQGICQDTVRRWINRFDRHGVDGLAPHFALRPRAGRRRRPRPRRPGRSSPPV